MTSFQHQSQDGDLLLQPSPSEFYTLRLDRDERHALRVERRGIDFAAVCVCGWYSGPLVSGALAERERCPFHEARLEFARNRAAWRALGHGARG